jgi:hypothetical protein
MLLMKSFYINLQSTRNNLSKLVCFLFCFLNCLHSFGFDEQQIPTPQFHFQENQGQYTDQNGDLVSDVLFKAESPGLNVWITTKGITYEMFTIHEKKQIDTDGEETKIKEKEWYRVDMELAEASISKDKFFGQKSNDVVMRSYYYSHCPDGIEIFGSYNLLYFSDIYPGIDWELKSEGGNIKYNFIVKPNADANQIQLILKGSGELSVQNNRIKFSTPLGSIFDGDLLCMQNEKTVYSKYAVVDLPNKIINGYSKSLSFNISAYNKSETLVIDPIIQWGTYFGGNAGDGVWSSVVDANDNLFICGWSGSSTFPKIDPGSVYYDGTLAGSWDIFVSKFNSSTTLLWSTYYGGTATELPYSMDVNSVGDVYVVGSTTNSTFPLFNPEGGAWYSTWQAQTSDGFILRFSNAGTRLWATYLGASVSGTLNSVVIDGSDNVFCVGQARATATTDPGGGAYIAAYSGSVNNGIIRKFNSSNQNIWRTNYGGDNTVITSADIDPSGSLFIAGYSSTTPTSLNPGGGAWMNSTTLNNEWSFIAKFTNGGVRQWHTNLGGNTPASRTTRAEEIHCDKNGTIFLAGLTTHTNFGALVNPGGSAFYDNTHNGNNDIFLLKFNSTLGLEWGTFIGGSGAENMAGSRGRELISDACGNIFLTGQTSSSNGAFTPIDPGCSSFYDGTNGGGTTYNYDAFIMSFNKNYEQKWMTFLGGTTDHRDFGSSFSFDTQGNLFWVGEQSGTVPSMYLLNNGGYYQATSGGDFEGFIMKFVPSELTLSTDITSGGTCSCEATVNTTCNTGPYVYSWDTSPTQTTQTTVGLCDGTYTATVTDSWCKTSSIDAIVLCNPLPVELLSFVAKCNNRTIELSWSTASESNSDYFMLEVSYNGLDYQVLGTFPAAGNSSAVLHYSWEDKILTDEVVYYRLTQFDFDGASKLYGPISVLADCFFESGSYIANNPSSTSIELVVNSVKHKDETAKIYVFSTDGRLIILTPVTIENGTNLISIPADYLASGSYFINIDWPAETESLIFIKH